MRASPFLQSLSLLTLALRLYDALMREGVLVAKKDFNAPKHHELDMPNLHVIKTCQSLTSKGFLKTQFSWNYYYYTLVRPRASASGVADDRRPTRASTTCASGSTCRPRLCPTRTRRCVAGLAAHSLI